MSIEMFVSDTCRGSFGCQRRSTSRYIATLVGEEHSCLKLRLFPSRNGLASSLCHVVIVHRAKGIISEERSCSHVP